MIYKTLILLTCHESKECLKDTILNYIKFNKDVCIVVNNGIHNDNLDELKSEHVHIVNRKIKKEWLWSLIPYHIELWDYIVENNIQAEYVITLSSNQSFVKHGLYELMKKYRAGYWARYLEVDNIRDFHCNCYQNSAMNYDITFCKNILNDLGKENFIHQSNHDGMFYAWDVYSDMMKYFENHRGMPIQHHSEEFFYVAYLIKHISKNEMAEYSIYNYHHSDYLTPTQIENIIKQDDKYIVKRITRSYDDPGRTYIRSLS